MEIVGTEAHEGVKSMKPYKPLKESSLSRLWRHNLAHDCGALTAFRKYTVCDETDGVLLTKEDNIKRNKSLTAKLLSKGYDVTRLIGKYPEGSIERKEISYFVVDKKDRGNLEQDMRELGEEFNQDSVLIIPKGAITNEAQAYLIGTNHCENNWLDYGKKQVFERGRLGYDSPIYTSYINGRPFIFETVDKKLSLPGSGMGIWLMERIARIHLTEIQ